MLVKSACGFDINVYGAQPLKKKKKNVQHVNFGTYTDDVSLTQSACIIHSKRAVKVLLQNLSLVKLKSKWGFQVAAEV